jgi:hypothetical protein
MHTSAAGMSWMPTGVFESSANSLVKIASVKVMPATYNSVQGYYITIKGISDLSKLLGAFSNATVPTGSPSAILGESCYATVDVSNNRTLVRLKSPSNSSTEIFITVMWRGGDVTDIVPGVQ